MNRSSDDYEHTFSIILSSSLLEYSIMMKNRLCDHTDLKDEKQLLVWLWFPCLQSCTHKKRRRSWLKYHGSVHNHTKFVSWIDCRQTITNDMVSISLLYFEPDLYELLCNNSLQTIRSSLAAIMTMETKVHCTQQSRILFAYYSWELHCKDCKWNFHHELIKWSQTGCRLMVTTVI